MDETLSTSQYMEKQNKKLSILYDVALTVGNSLDLESVLHDVLEMIIDFMGVDAGVIYVINDVTMEMLPIAFKNLSKEVVKELCENKVKVGECMCGNIAQCNREVVILEKASDDPRFTREVLKKEGMEFYAGLPLRAKGKVVGVLCAITHTPYSLDRELLDILRAATQPIGLAIENALIFENARREAELSLKYHDFEGIIANSPQMAKVLRMVRKVTDVTSSILLYGESGTGKELIARAIHFNSPRKEKPFIAVNCAAIPETLLESELFGYTKGAFTGANADKIGLFEAGDKGTILLDEVETMSKGLQVKLLRVLQDGTFQKVGNPRPIGVDVRIIAATNQDLEEAVKTKLFREDLYYRLNVIRISLPPLRERVEDIPLLVRFFINKFNKKMGKNIRRVSEDAMDALINHAWPGNVRELEHVIERATVVTETEEITGEDLPTEITSVHGKNVRKDWTIESVEKEHILKILNLAQGSRKKAADLLGLDPATLWRKLRKYRISS